MSMEAKQLEPFLNSFHQGIALIDGQMNVVAANTHFYLLLPLTQAEPNLSVAYPQFVAHTGDYLAAARDGTQSRIERFPWESYGRSSYWLLHFNPVTLNLGNGDVAMLIIEDISEQVSMVSQFESNYNELQQQLTAARRYQDALFTESYRGEDVSCKAYAKPCFELSGDFFHASKYGESSLFIVGDVQSHGIDVALRSITLQHLAKIWFTEAVSPAKVMADLNNFILNDQDEEMWLCCLLVIFYNRQLGAVTYCRAGIPEPVILRRDGEIVKLDVGGTPLGAFPGEDYIESSMTVYPQDRLLMFSDGITESRKPGNTETMYGHENLIADYANAALGNTEHHLLKILDSIHRYTGTNDFDDDVTLAEVIFS